MEISIVGTVAFLCILMVCSYALVKRVIFHWIQRDIFHLIGETYVPMTLLLLYGWFALPLLVVEPVNLPTYLGVNFDNGTLAFALFVMVVAGLVYAIGFNLVFNEPLNLTISPRYNMLFFDRFMILLFVLDIIVRYQKIVLGQYFSWMRGRAIQMYGDGQSPLWLLQEGIVPVLIAWAYFRSRDSKWFLYCLGFLLFAILLEGSRQKIGLALLSLLLVHLFVLNIQISLRKAVVAGLLLLVASSALSSVILTMRAVYRSDMISASSNPVDFLQKMVIEVIPGIIVGRETGVSEGLEGAELVDRLPSWSVSFASAVEAHRHRGDLPLRYLFAEGVVIVPAALWVGEKPAGVGISTVVAHHYGLWNPRSRSLSADLASTSFVMPYLYFGLAGVLLFGGLLGLLVGITFKLIASKLNLYAIFFVIGGTGFLKIMSNSYVGVLVGVRNFLILFLLVLVFGWIFRRPRYY